MQGDKFAQVSIDERKAALESIVRRIYQLKDLPEKDMASLAGIINDLEYRISHRWPSITLAEIALALEAGCCGEYTRETKPTTANMAQWLAMYFGSQDRADALKKKSTMVEVQTVAWQEREKLNEEFRQKEPAYLWDIFCRGDEKELDYEFNTMAGYVACVFDALRSWGRLQVITPETMEKAKAWAKQGKRSLTAVITEESHRVKSYIVYKYFENLRKAGRRLEYGGNTY